MGFKDKTKLIIVDNSYLVSKRKVNNPAKQVLHALLPGADAKTTFIDYSRFGLEIIVEPQCYKQLLQAEAII